MAEEDATPGRRLDLISDLPSAADACRPPRPFLGIRFACCNLYARIYRNALQTAYEGRCPRCGGRVRVPIGPGGRSSRFFEAGR